ncbi:TroA family protein [Desulforhopalus singaporensis]|uniref:Helix-turn-helix domain-containing protein n=1 Tax=Desulforhopalus singaporensis TaxID=91360 RepID=A0A1H0KGH9_9BACT|nr:hypothetical protein [Desulforhopalus singaporensis]SDO55088.1 hypothetical protein SAMN05660330_00494 [Desulforhopalus singaporensis]
MQSTNDNEYLTFSRAASLCCVSTTRFKRWTESGLIPVVDCHGHCLISSHDLIRHLVRYNMPIPNLLLQGRVKKILIVFLQLIVSGKVTRQIVRALYRLKEKTSCILECISYDANTELKVITFNPDVIVLFGKKSHAEKIVDRIRSILTGTVNVYCFSPAQTVELQNTLKRLGR